MKIIMSIIILIILIMSAGMTAMIMFIENRRTTSAAARAYMKSLHNLVHGVHGVHVGTSDLSISTSIYRSSIFSSSTFYFLFLLVDRTWVQLLMVILLSSIFSYMVRSAVLDLRQPAAATYNARSARRTSFATFIFCTSFVCRLLPSFWYMVHRCRPSSCTKCTSFRRVHDVQMTMMVH